MRVFELGITAKKYVRSPRKVGKNRSREWCDRDMIEMGEAMFSSQIFVFRVQPIKNYVKK